MDKKKRLQILYRMHDKYPYPTIELLYNNPFELLIAVILSSKSTDISVNKVTPKLFSIANTPQDMISLGIENIKNHINSIGLFNNKAKNIVDLCHIILKKYKGNIPENRIALESLPGVGRKTANIILNTVFGWPTIAVDTHVFRVSNRTGFALGNNVTNVEKQLLLLVPKKYIIYCHHWLNFHGRYTCSAKNPHCSTCLIEDLCEFNYKYVELS